LIWVEHFVELLVLGFSVVVEVKNREGGKREEWEEDEIDGGQDMERQNTTYL
jgi:hypothetical protein